MKSKIITVLSIVLISTSVTAQTEDWTTEKAHDDKITVTYRISERTDELGNVVTLIEDSTTTIASVSYQNCIQVFKDISSHKEFTGDEMSERVRTVSDTSWLVYYFMDNPWPVSNSDCVAKMTFTENEDANLATFSLVAAPTEYEMGSVNRMTYYNVKYKFKDIGNGKVEITVTARTTPPVNVPDWLLKSAFPSAPADAVYRLVNHLK